MTLERNDILTLFVAVICIASIGVAAATITSAITVDDGSGGGLEYEPGEGENPNAEQPNVSIDPEGGVDDSAPLSLDTCVRFFTEPYGLLAFVGAFVMVIYGIYRRWSMGMAMLSSYGIAPFALIAYFLLTNCPESGGPGVNEQTPNGSVVGDALGTEVVGTPDISPVWLIVIFGLAMVGIGAVLYSAGRDEVVEETGDVEESEPDASDLAEAAGRAADRLQQRDADVDNEVYRAWYEMTQLLPVSDADSATAGEFADAAVDAGLSREHVDELTVLFEEVRYGTAEADEEREEHAIDVFRRIETMYSDESSATDRTNDETGSEVDE